MCDPVRVILQKQFPVFPLSSCSESASDAHNSWYASLVGTSGLLQSPIRHYFGKQDAHFRNFEYQL